MDDLEIDSKIKEIIKTTKKRTGVYVISKGDYKILFSDGKPLYSIDKDGMIIFYPKLTKVGDELILRDKETNEIIPGLPRRYTDLILGLHRLMWKMDV